MILHVCDGCGSEIAINDACYQSVCGDCAKGGRRKVFTACLRCQRYGVDVTDFMLRHYVAVHRVPERALAAEVRPLGLREVWSWVMQSEWRN